VQLVGVVPGDEALVGRWTERLSAGRFLDPAATGETGGELVIGAPLAKRMDLELDSRVVLTAADVATGEARSELLKVVGFLKTSDPAVDETAAVVLLPVGQRLLGLGAAVHEVALRLHTPRTNVDIGIDTENSEAIVKAIAPLSVIGQVEPIAWHAAQPLVAEMMKMRSSWTWIFLGLIFTVIAFVIVGTVSMALLERTWEFALLRALGAPPLRLASVVLAESAWLGLVGALPGALMGYALAALMGKVGIRFGEDVTMVVSFSEPIRPVPDAVVAIQYAAVFTGLTVLVSAAAAWRAARVEPALTLRNR
jgi:putative ABC transport system permease protein